jgi:hypothetical protein
MVATTQVAMLQSRDGFRTAINFDGGALPPLVRNGSVDAYIVSVEDGFSPLGHNRRFLASALGRAESQIRSLAYWNRFENDSVSLVGLPAETANALLRGVILCPSETSVCYASLAQPFFGKPYRDFYYRVTHAAISHAVEVMGARRLAISHLSGSGNFHADIATCNAEALAHYCDANPGRIDSFTFLGCCIEAEHLAGIRRLNAEGGLTRFLPFAKSVEQCDGHTLIHLEVGGLRPCSIGEPAAVA